MLSVLETDDDIVFSSSLSSIVELSLLLAVVAAEVKVTAVVTGEHIIGGCDSGGCEEDGVGAVVVVVESVESNDDEFELLDLINVVELKYVAI